MKYKLIISAMFGLTALCASATTVTKSYVQGVAYDPNNSTYTPYLNYCDMSTGGALTNCVTDTNAAPMGWPYGMSTDNGYLYVSDASAPDGSSIPPGRVYIYHINNENPTTGSIGSPLGDVDLGAADIAVYDGFLYYNHVGNAEDTLYRCPINSNGTIDVNGCGVALTISGSYLYQVAFNNDDAYVADYAHHAIQHCMVNTNDGTLGNCTAITSSAFAGPYALARVEDYLYIVNLDSTSEVSNMSVCQIESNGTLSGCEATTINEYGYFDISAYNNNSLYIPNYIEHASNVMRYCTVEGDGGLDCQSFDAPPANPINLAFATTTELPPL